MPISLRHALTAASLLSLGMLGHQNARADLEIGQPLPAFTLPGVDDQQHSADDYRDARILVVLFTCNHCPTAQAYESRVIDLEKEYRSKGVQLVAISPNDALAVRLDELGYTDLGDSLEDMKVRAKDQGFEFPYLYDGETQKTSREFGVIATPHVFVFDQQRQLRYKGRIDDSEVGVVKSQDLRNALDALLSGKPVPVEVTRPFGCSTKWSDKRQSAVDSIAQWNQEPVELQTLTAEDLQTLAANDTENYRLINVWATWCVPCIEELPEFVEMNRMYRRRHFELITISADEKDAHDAALNILKSHFVAAKNYRFDSESRDALFDGLDSEWKGGIPYTVLIAPGGKVVYRQHDSIDAAELKRVIADHLGRTYASRKE